MKDAVVALTGAGLGALLALTLLFILPTEVRTDYERCMETRSIYEGEFDAPPPCWVAVFIVD